MVRMSYMTVHSFNKQYNESDEHYDYFKIYLKQGKTRSIKKVHDTTSTHVTTSTSAGELAAPDIEQVTLISNRWKWIYRAADYDYYQNILSQHKQAQQQLENIDERLSYLENVATNTMNNSTMVEKDRLNVLEKIAKNEVILNSKRQKSYQIIKKTCEELKKYDENKYNFEAEKQKDLLTALTDYNNGFIDKSEYDIITLDYPEKIVEQIENQYNNPLDSLTKLTNPI